MYGTLSFGKKNKSPSTELHAFKDVRGKRLRRPACERCRSARVKCNGRASHKTNCERCHNLGKTCSHSMGSERAEAGTSTQQHSTADTEQEEGQLAPDPAAFPHPTETPVSSLPSISISINSSNSPEETEQLLFTPVDDNYCWEQPLDLNPDLSDWDLALHFDLDALDDLVDFENTVLDLKTHVPSILFPHAYDLGDQQLAGNAAPAQGDMIDAPQTQCSYSGAGMDGPCSCLQNLVLGLFNGRAMLSHLNSRSGRRLTPEAEECGVPKYQVGVDDYLNQVKHSMTSIRAVESCRLTCFRTQNFALLLLMNIEQLAKLQIELASGITCAYEGTIISIGSYSVEDPAHKRIMIEQMLTAHMLNLDGCITRLCGRMLHEPWMDNVHEKFNVIRTGLRRTLGKCMASQNIEDLKT